MRRLHHYFALCLALALSGPSVPPAFADSPEPGSPEFQPCADAETDPTLAGTLCGRIAAPLDHAAPERGSIDLFVRKFPAVGPTRGEFWMIAGGPGESGASFYPFIDTVRAAAPGFDIVIPDHRGTGFSTRLCPDEESPDSPGGAALAGAEWGSCFGSLNSGAERAAAFTITNAARDLALLMDRLPVAGPRFLYGVSYGTQLVLRTFVVAPPASIDGVVLDSLVPPEDSEAYDLSRRSALVDRIGRTVLTDTAALETVLGDPDLAAPLGPRPKYVLGALLDLPETRDMLPEIVAGLAAGDPAVLEAALAKAEALGARLSAYPQAPSSVPLVSLISRSENTARPGLTAEQIASEKKGYLFASPLPGQLVQGGFPVYARDGNFGASPDALPPTLILHGDLDPKTAYPAAIEHGWRIKDAGSVGFVTVRGGPHYLLMTAPGCFIDNVGKFVARKAIVDPVCDIAEAPGTN